MTLIPLSDGRPGVRAMLEVQVRESADSQPILEFTASNATLDRYREVIEPAGWRLDNYLRNPVFLNSHNYGDIIYTIGKAIHTEVRDGALRQRIQFATDANPLARIAYGLYRGGFLNAVSVGFIPIRWENGDTKDFASEGRADCPQSAGSGPSTLNLQPSTPTLKTDGFRRRYLEQELIEVSAVTVPANPDALQLTMKTGAFTRADLVEAAEMLNCFSRSVPQPSTQPLLRIARLLHQAMRNA